MAKFEEGQFGLLSDLITPRVRQLTLADLKAYRTTLKTGQHSYADYQATFASLCASRDAILLELNDSFQVDQLARFATVFGIRSAMRTTMEVNAEEVYRGMLRSFVLDDAFAIPDGAALEKEVAKRVRATTSQEWLDYHRRKDWERVQSRE